MRRFNDVTVHNNTDVLLHDSDQKPPSTIGAHQHKKRKAAAAGNYFALHRSCVQCALSLRLCCGAVWNVYTHFTLFVWPPLHAIDGTFLFHIFVSRYFIHINWLFYIFRAITSKHIRSAVAIHANEEKKHTFLPNVYGSGLLLYLIHFGSFRALAVSGCACVRATIHLCVCLCLCLVVSDGVNL